MDKKVETQDPTELTGGQAKVLSSVKPLEEPVSELEIHSVHPITKRRWAFMESGLLRVHCVTVTASCCAQSYDGSSDSASTLSMLYLAQHN